MTGKKAWVTLATNDTYCLGALVLAHSLKKVNTAHELVVLVTSNVSSVMRGTLQSVFDDVKEVNIIDSGDAENLRLLARPELGITFTKLHCWKLTQHEKCVFLDADTLVLQNCDELFEREELSAAPDIGWPDCFNSGVFVFKPSEETYNTLVDFALAHGSFDGGDQGLLNMYYSNWATGDTSKRLPFLYNLSSAAVYSYLPAFKWYGKGVKIVHFIGISKPWLQPFNSVTRKVQPDPTSSHLTNFLQYWWDLFCNSVHPQLSPEMSGLASTLAQMKLDEASSEQIAREDEIRRQNWEQGNIDYMGRDSFDNIWNKISQTMNQAASKPETQTETPVLSAAPVVADTPQIESPTPVPSAAPVVADTPQVESPIKQPSPPKSETVEDSAHCTLPPTTPIPSAPAEAGEQPAVSLPSAKPEIAEPAATSCPVTASPVSAEKVPSPESTLVADAAKPAITSTETALSSPAPVTVSSVAVATSNIAESNTPESSAAKETSEPSKPSEKPSLISTPDQVLSQPPPVSSSATTESPKPSSIESVAPLPPSDSTKTVGTELPPLSTESSELLSPKLVASIGAVKEPSQPESAVASQKTEPSEGTTSAESKNTVDSSSKKDSDPKTSASKNASPQEAKGKQQQPKSGGGKKK